MNNVTPFKLDDQALEETTNLYFLCKSGATRTFAFRDPKSDSCRLFALLHRGQDHYALYARGELSTLYHLESLITGGLPAAIAEARELLGEGWEMVP